MPTTQPNPDQEAFIQRILIAQEDAWYVEGQDEPLLETHGDINPYDDPNTPAPGEATGFCDDNGDGTIDSLC
ncbi:MAG: hypothetical protein OHK0017_01750 [Patescibacteria group bacterium]